MLHDGPPYANGDLHMGHFLNKVLKDILNRSMVIKGRSVNFVPGWDCHGLPIELKVLQSVNKKERQELSGDVVRLRELATSFASETVQKQSESFQRYGVLGNFDDKYVTMDKTYESQQVKLFGDLYDKKVLYRGTKPVHWSPSSMTALAEAELEYPNNHVSKSVYVKFKIETLPDSLKAHFDENAYLGIWTTTPWTIPANLAVAVNEDLSYSILKPASGKGGTMIVATDLIGKMTGIMSGNGESGGDASEEFQVSHTFPGSELTGATYLHPLNGSVNPVISGGNYITTETGTGLVHTAPGHGDEDYKSGLKHGLDCFSPVDDRGRFTSEAGERFQGLSVLKEGNDEVIAALSETGALILLEDYNHKYPYDWRTKKPTIFRATPQWFCSVNDFKDEALSAIEGVKWVPEIGKNRITSFVTARSDWCISRQRTWGVPIPVFYEAATGEVLINGETIQRVAQVFKEHGSDAWWTWDIKDLLPESYRDRSSEYVKGTDTMDVWFDSGSSWTGVLSSRPDLRYPADVYLEGSDQHRGRVTI